MVPVPHFLPLVCSSLITRLWGLGAMIFHGNCQQLLLEEFLDSVLSFSLPDITADLLPPTQQMLNWNGKDRPALLLSPLRPHLPAIPSACTCSVTLFIPLPPSPLPRCHIPPTNFSFSTRYTLQAGSVPNLDLLCVLASYLSGGKRPAFGSAF